MLKTCLKEFFYPSQLDIEEILKRPKEDFSDLFLTVDNLIQEVLAKGDKALFEFSKKFDLVELDEFRVKRTEILDASVRVPAKLRDAIEVAYRNIFTFHSSQIQAESICEVSSGIECWRKSLPIEKVGLYIPGGSAPLFSSLLMLGIPAKLAGCKQIVVCSPPAKDGSLASEILFVAQRLGIEEVFKLGGAQAIAAMAYGTESIPKVDKIFGPGNRYVTAAKMLLNSRGVPIDIPAGPSELMIIADESADPRYLAADLLSQAEHGEDSQVVLISISKDLIEKTQKYLQEYLHSLSRRETIIKSLCHSKAILLSNLDEAINASNFYAPEHLIIACKDCERLAQKVQAAGSVFLGNYSSESAGDYASGTNHTLPTSAYARAYSGVSLDSFVKKITYQKLSKSGLMSIANAVIEMATAEGLDAHKLAIDVRQE